MLNKLKTKFKNNKKGASLIMILVTMSVLMILGSTFGALAKQSLDQSYAKFSIEQAKLTADVTCNIIDKELSGGKLPKLVKMLNQALADAKFDGKEHPDQYIMRLPVQYFINRNGDNTISNEEKVLLGSDKFGESYVEIKYTDHNKKIVDFKVIGKYKGFTSSVSYKYYVQTNAEKEIENILSNAMFVKTPIVNIITKEIQGDVYIDNPREFKVNEHNEIEEINKNKFKEIHSGKFAISEKDVPEPFDKLGHTKKVDFFDRKIDHPNKWTEVYIRRVFFNEHAERYPELYGYLKEQIEFGGEKRNFYRSLKGNLIVNSDALIGLYDKGAIVKYSNGIPSTYKKPTLDYDALSRNPNEYINYSEHGYGDETNISFDYIPKLKAKTGQNVENSYFGMIGDLYVNGNARIENIIQKGNQYISGSAVIAGPRDYVTNVAMNKLTYRHLFNWIDGDVYIDGNAYIENTIITGNVYVNGRICEIQNSTIGGNLYVTNQESTPVPSYTYLIDPNHPNAGRDNKPHEISSGAFLKDDELNYGNNGRAYIIKKEKYFTYNHVNPYDYGKDNLGDLNKYYSNDTPVTNIKYDVKIGGSIKVNTSLILNLDSDINGDVIAYPKKPGSSEDMDKENSFLYINSGPKSKNNINFYRRYNDNKFFTISGDIKTTAEQVHLSSIRLSNRYDKSLYRTVGGNIIQINKGAPDSYLILNAVEYDYKVNVEKAKILSYSEKVLIGAIENSQNQDKCCPNLYPTQSTSDTSLQLTHIRASIVLLNAKSNENQFSDLLFKDASTNNAVVIQNNTIIDGSLYVGNNQYKNSNLIIKDSLVKGDVTVQGSLKIQYRNKIAGELFKTKGNIIAKDKITFDNKDTVYIGGYIQSLKDIDLNNVQVMCSKSTSDYAINSINGKITLKDVISFSGNVVAEKDVISKDSVVNQGNVISYKGNVYLPVPSENNNMKTILVRYLDEDGSVLASNNSFVETSELIDGDESTKRHKVILREPDIKPYKDGKLFLGWVLVRGSFDGYYDSDSHQFTKIPNSNTKNIYIFDRNLPDEIDKQYYFTYIKSQSVEIKKDENDKNNFYYNKLFDDSSHIIKIFDFDTDTIYFKDNEYEDLNFMPYYDKNPTLTQQIDIDNDDIVADLKFNYEEYKNILNEECFKERNFNIKFENITNRINKIDSIFGIEASKYKHLELPTSISINSKNGYQKIYNQINPVNPDNLNFYWCFEDDLNNGSMTYLRSNYMYILVACTKRGNLYTPIADGHVKIKLLLENKDLKSKITYYDENDKFIAETYFLEGESPRELIKLTEDNKLIDSKNVEHAITDWVNKDAIEEEDKKIVIKREDIHSTMNLKAKWRAVDYNYRYDILDGSVSSETVYDIGFARPWEHNEEAWRRWGYGDLYYLKDIDFNKGEIDKKVAMFSLDGYYSISHNKNEDHILKQSNNIYSMTLKVSHNYKDKDENFWNKMLPDKAILGKEGKNKTVLDLPKNKWKINKNPVTNDVSSLEYKGWGNHIIYKIEYDSIDYNKELGRNVFLIFERSGASIGLISMQNNEINTRFYHKTLYVQYGYEPDIALNWNRYLPEVHYDFNNESKYKEENDLNDYRITRFKKGVYPHYAISKGFFSKYKLADDFSDFAISRDRAEMILSSRLLSNKNTLQLPHKLKNVKPEFWRPLLPERFIKPNEDGSFTIVNLDFSSWDINTDKIKSKDGEIEFNLKYDKIWPNNNYKNNTFKVLTSEEGYKIGLVCDNLNYQDSFNAFTYLHIDTLKINSNSNKKLKVDSFKNLVPEVFTYKLQNGTMFYKNLEKDNWSLTEIDDHNDALLYKEKIKDEKGDDLEVTRFYYRISYAITGSTKNYQTIVLKDNSGRRRALLTLNKAKPLHSKINDDYLKQYLYVQGKKVNYDELEYKSTDGTNKNFSVVNTIPDNVTYENDILVLNAKYVEYSLDYGSSFYNLIFNHELFNNNGESDKNAFDGTPLTNPETLSLKMDNGEIVRKELTKNDKFKLYSINGVDNPLVLDLKLKSIELRNSNNDLIQILDEEGESVKVVQYIDKDGNPVIVKDKDNKLLKNIIINANSENSYKAILLTNLDGRSINKVNVKDKNGILVKNLMLKNDDRIEYTDDTGEADKTAFITNIANEEVQLTVVKNQNLTDVNIINDDNRKIVLKSEDDKLLAFGKVLNNNDELVEFLKIYNNDGSEVVENYDSQRPALYKYKLKNIELSGQKYDINSEINLKNKLKHKTIIIHIMNKDKNGFKTIEKYSFDQYDFEYMLNRGNRPLFRYWKLFKGEFYFYEDFQENNSDQETENKYNFNSSFKDNVLAYKHIDLGNDIKNKEAYINYIKTLGNDSVCHIYLYPKFTEAKYVEVENNIAKQLVVKTQEVPSNSGKVMFNTIPSTTDSDKSYERAIYHAKKYPFTQRFICRLDNGQLVYTDIKDKSKDYPTQYQIINTEILGIYKPELNIDKADVFVFNIDDSLDFIVKTSSCPDGIKDQLQNPDNYISSELEENKKIIVLFNKDKEFILINNVFAYNNVFIGFSDQAYKKGTDNHAAGCIINNPDKDNFEIAKKKIVAYYQEDSARNNHKKYFIMSIAANGNIFANSIIIHKGNIQSEKRLYVRKSTINGDIKSNKDVELIGSEIAGFAKAKEIIKIDSSKVKQNVETVDTSLESIVITGSREHKSYVNGEVHTKGGVYTLFTQINNSIIALKDVKSKDSLVDSIFTQSNTSSSVIVERTQEGNSGVISNVKSVGDVKIDNVTNTPNIETKGRIHINDSKNLGSDMISIKTFSNSPDSIKITSKQDNNDKLNIKLLETNGSAKLGKVKVNNALRVKADIDIVDSNVDVEIKTIGNVNIKRSNIKDKIIANGNIKVEDGSKVKSIDSLQDIYINGSKVEGNIKSNKIVKITASEINGKVESFYDEYDKNSKASIIVSGSTINDTIGTNGGLIANFSDVKSINVKKGITLKGTKVGEIINGNINILITDDNVVFKKLIHINGEFNLNANNVEFEKTAYIKTFNVLVPTFNVLVPNDITISGSGPLKVAKFNYKENGRKTINIENSLYILGESKSDKQKIENNIDYRFIVNGPTLYINGDYSATHDQLNGGKDKELVVNGNVTLSDSVKLNRSVYAAEKLHIHDFIDINQTDNAVDLLANEIEYTTSDKMIYGGYKGRSVPYTPDLKNIKYGFTYADKSVKYHYANDIWKKVSLTVSSTGWEMRQRLQLGDIYSKGEINIKLDLNEQKNNDKVIVFFGGSKIIGNKINIQQDSSRDDVIKFESYYDIYYKNNVSIHGNVKGDRYTRQVSDLSQFLDSDMKAKVEKWKNIFNETIENSTHPFDDINPVKTNITESTNNTTVSEFTDGQKPNPKIEDNDKNYSFSEQIKKIKKFEQSTFEQKLKDLQSEANSSYSNSVNELKELYSNSSETGEDKKRMMFDSNIDKMFKEKISIYWKKEMVHAKNWNTPDTTHYLKYMNGKDELWKVLPDVEKGNRILQQDVVIEGRLVVPKDKILYINASLKNVHIVLKQGLTLEENAQIILQGEKHGFIYLDIDKYKYKKQGGKQEINGKLAPNLANPHIVMEANSKIKGIKSEISLGAMFIVSTQAITFRIEEGSRGFFQQEPSEDELTQVNAYVYMPNGYIYFTGAKKLILRGSYCVGTYLINGNFVDIKSFINNFFNIEVSDMSVMFTYNNINYKWKKPPLNFGLGDLYYHNDDNTTGVDFEDSNKFNLKFVEFS